ncbi:MAG: O-antigen ligase family protein, partial [Gemmatimonadaceae bacterium]|nr:O-antigen ligase family protein [Gemmatimonadaceae bacterium]
LCHVPFAIYLLRPGVSIVRRIFALAVLAAMVYVIVGGASRGGFIGLLAIGLYVLLRYRGIPMRIRISAIVGGFLMFALVADASYWDRMRSLLNPKADYNWAGNSKTGRMEVWERGVGYMIRNPLLGVGLRNFTRAEGHSELSMELQEGGSGFKWSVAHSSWIEIGAELGIIGFVAFIALFVTAIRSMARVQRIGSPPGTGPPLELAQSQMLLGSLLGFVICGSFLSAEHFAMPYILLGMVVGLLKLLSLSGRRVAPAGTRPIRPAPMSARKASRLQQV